MALEVAEVAHIARGLTGVMRGTATPEAQDDLLVLDEPVQIGIIGQYIYSIHRVCMCVNSKRKLLGRWVRADALRIEQAHATD